MSSAPSSEPVRKRLPVTVLLLGTVLVLLASCGTGGRKSEPASGPAISFSSDKFDAEAFARDLSAALPPVDTTDSTARARKIPSVATNLRNVYQQHDYLPLWIDEKGHTSAAESLLQELDTLRWDGLDPESFGASKIRKQLKDLKVSDVPALVALDTSCTLAYLRASRELLLGALLPRSADSLWFHSNDSAWKAPDMLVQTLGKDGKYPSLDSFRSRIPTYALLLREHERLAALAKDERFTTAKKTITSIHVPDSITAYIIRTEVPGLESAAGDSLSGQAGLLKAYQDHYGLKPTGRLDSNTFRVLQRQPDTVARLVRANLERLRWLPQQMEQTYVLVNIPLMEFFYKDREEDVFRMRVVVGRSSRQTPVLNANMANVVFNPSWGVPPTILKKDVLPGLSKRGGSYLARKGLKAYDAKGNVVDAGSINASNYRRYNFRQPPGARNALGEIKFNMPNRWDIYLHDTPHREDFPRRDRALSSGCVRVEKPREFAEFILTKLENRPEFDQTVIDSLIQLRKTRYEVLQNKIPVHLVYLTVFDNDDHSGVRYLNDVYRRDRKLMTMIW